MLPSEEAVALATIRNDYKEEKSEREKKERRRLAREDGRICFDLFGELAGKLLCGSEKIRRLVSSVFPVVMLDEFQDTNKEQWAAVKQMGEGSRLIALADPEQRIFDFIGAAPERLDHYKKFAKPREFNLGGTNYRSAGTDILKFGDDVLRGKFQNSPYRGVNIECFPPNPNQALAALRNQTLQARRRLLDGNENDWSLAILVPTKKMVRQVSEVFGDSKPKKPEISHYAVVDMEASILAAGVLAFLLQPESPEEGFSEFVKLLANYFLGKGGDAPTKTNIEEAQRIRKAAELKKSGKKPRKNSIIIPILEGYRKCRSLELLGNPEEDWLNIRKILEEARCSRLQDVAKDTRNLRLLGRGTQFRDALSQAWRDTGVYTDAFHIAERSFVQEDLITSNKLETGVIIMNMHKAKGKQFDEVIIFEGWPRRKGNSIVSNPDRIVRGNKRRENLNSFRQNLRVSVTRARNRTTIMTPQSDPCILLFPQM